MNPSLQFTTIAFVDDAISTAGCIRMSRATHAEH